MPTDFEVIGNCVSYRMYSLFHAVDMDVYPTSINFDVDIQGHTYFSLLLPWKRKKIIFLSIHLSQLARPSLNPVLALL